MTDMAAAVRADDLDALVASDIRFHPLRQLPFHPNALTFSADLVTGETRTGTWYSIGGGFIVRDGDAPSTSGAAKLPYPIDTAADLLKWCDKTGWPVSRVVWENERAWRPAAATRDGLLRIGT